MKLKALFAAAAVALIGTAAQAATFSTVSVYNTYENPAATGGVEVGTFFYEDVAISDTEVEVDDIFNLYDIDVTGNELTFTVIDNTDDTADIIEADTYDRYYIEFDEAILSYTVDVLLSDVNAVVTEIAAGTSYTWFNVVLGELQTVEFENGGLIVEFGPGTDLTRVGDTLLSIEVQAVPVPAALPLFLTALGGFAFVARRRKSA